MNDLSDEDEEFMPNNLRKELEEEFLFKKKKRNKEESLYGESGGGIFTPFSLFFSLNLFLTF